MCIFCNEKAAIGAAALSQNPILAGSPFGGGQYYAANEFGMFLPVNPPFSSANSRFASDALFATPKIEIRTKGIAAEQLAKFFDYLKENKSNKTAQSYYGDVRNVLNAISANHFGGVPLDKLDLSKITLEHVRQAEREVIKHGKFKPKTRERMKQGWNRFCKFLGMVDWKCKVRINATEPYRKNVISSDDVIKMLEYCREQRAAATSDAEIILLFRKEIALLVGFEMGLRSCEYVNVTFGEVENDDQITIKNSKGDGSREVSVMKETRNAILEFKAFLKARNLLPKNDGVFEKPEGGYYSTSSFRRWMKQTAAACGIRAKLAQTHGLRHRYAMNYYTHTKNLVVLARLMGHKSLKTTRQYAEPTFESVQESMQESVDRAYGILPQAA